jgi:hypothetical protein
MRLAGRGGGADSHRRKVGALGLCALVIGDRYARHGEQSNGHECHEACHLRDSPLSNCSIIPRTPNSDQGSGVSPLAGSYYDA